MISNGRIRRVGPKRTKRTIFHHGVLLSSGACFWPFSVSLTSALFGTALRSYSTKPVSERRASTAKVNSHCDQSFLPPAVRRLLSASRSASVNSTEELGSSIETSPYLSDADPKQIESVRAESIPSISVYQS